MAREEFVAKAAVFGSPERLAELVERERDGVSHDEFMNRPENQPLKDGWQAATFSLGYQRVVGKPVDVRLSSSEQFPDFKLKVEGVEHDFENVMIVTKALGKEYKGDTRTGPIKTPVPTSVPPFDPAPLLAGIQRKIDKHYAGDVNLLVYVNYKGGNVAEAEIVREVQRVCGDEFESVWLLVYGRETGSSGAPVNMVLCARPSPKLEAPVGWQIVPTIAEPMR